MYLASVIIVLHEKTLRHVHIKGRNKTMTCNYWYRHS